MTRLAKQFTIGVIVASLAFCAEAALPDPESPPQNTDARVNAFVQAVPGALAAPTSPSDAYPKRATLRRFAMK